jgi:Fur family ferric uptake transcriptional regulator
MKSHTLKNVEKLLKQTGLRKTRQRIGILKVLARAKQPLTQEQIGNKLRKAAPNKVTIYRCLEDFIEAGLVHRAYLHDRTEHYELGDNCTELQCHPHFTCTNCGEIFCLKGLFPPLTKGLKKGFVVHRQQVRIEGLCSACS